MANESDFQGYEHSRRSHPSFKTLGFAWQGARTLKPLIGGFVAFAFVAAFLAIRGGDSVVINELTGEQRGGWSRLEDVHLLIVVNVAIVVGLAVQFLAQYVRHWLQVWLALMMGAILIPISQSNDLSSAWEHSLIGGAIGFAALALLVMLFDARSRQRVGY